MEGQTESSARTDSSENTEVHLRVPSEVVTTAFANAFKLVQKRVRIDGFRVGKAPLHIVRRMYGREISRHVTEELIDKGLQGAIAKEELPRFIRRPPVYYQEEAQEGKDFSFSVRVGGADAVLGIKRIGRYKGLPLVYQYLVGVSDKSIDAEIERVRGENAKSRVLNEGTKAALGHQVLVSCQARQSGSSTPPLLDLDKELVVLGGTKREDTKLPAGLHKEVAGMTTGEHREFEHTVPSSVLGEDEAKLNVDLTLHEVREVILPDVDKQFAEDICGDASVASLRSFVKNTLENRFMAAERRNMEQQLLMQLIDSSEVIVPPALIDKAVAASFQGSSSLTENTGNSELLNMLRENAEAAIKSKIILAEIARREKITAEPQSRARNRTRQNKSGAYQNDPERILENKVFEFLINMADIETLPIRLGEKGLAGSDSFDLSPLKAAAKVTKLGQYKGLSLQRIRRQVTPELIDAELKSMLQRRAVPKKLSQDSKVEMGHMLDISCQLTVGGVPASPDLAVQDFVLGKHMLVPTAVGDKIVGMQAGEQRKINHTFIAGEEWRALGNGRWFAEEPKAGTVACFAITVNAIFEVVLPQLDDEFARQYYGFESVADLREYAKSLVDGHLTRQEQTELQVSAIDKVISASEVFIPADALEKAVDSSIANIGSDKMFSRAECKEKVTHMSKHALVFAEIAQQEGLTSAAGDMNAKVLDLLLKEAVIAEKNAGDTNDD